MAILSWSNKMPTWETVRMEERKITATINYPKAFYTSMITMGYVITMGMS
jgi:hypothetical protein